MIFSAYPDMPSSLAGGTRTRGAPRKGIPPCGSSCMRYPILTSTCNIWCRWPIQGTRRLLPVHHYVSPGGVLMWALILSLILCAPMPLFFDGRAACSLASTPRSAKMRLAWVLALSHCIDFSWILASGMTSSIVNYWSIIVGQSYLRSSALKSYARNLRNECA